LTEDESEEEHREFAELPSWSRFCSLDEPVQFECQSARGQLSNAEPELHAESCITCTSASIKVTRQTTDSTLHTCKVTRQTTDSTLHTCEATCCETRVNPMPPTVQAAQRANQLTTQPSLPSIPQVRQLTVLRHSGGSSVQLRQATMKTMPSTARVSSKPSAVTVRDNLVIAKMPVGLKMTSLPNTFQYGTTATRVPSQTMLQLLPMFSGPDSHHQMSCGSSASTCLSAASAR